LENKIRVSIAAGRVSKAEQWSYWWNKYQAWEGYKNNCTKTNWSTFGILISIFTDENNKGMWEHYAGSEWHCGFGENILYWCEFLLIFDYQIVLQFLKRQYLLQSELEF
jgi:hypothetical protein